METAAKVRKSRWDNDPKQGQAHRQKLRATKQRAKWLSFVYEMHVTDTNHMIEYFKDDLSEYTIKDGIETAHPAELIAKLNVNRNQFWPDEMTWTKWTLWDIRRAGVTVPYKCFKPYRPKDTEEAPSIAEHDLQTARFLANVRTGAKKYGLTYIPQGQMEALFMGGETDDPIFLTSEILGKPKYRKSTGTTEALPYRIYPDGAFGLVYPDGGELFCLVENQNDEPVTRGPKHNRSLELPSVYKKMVLYQHIIKERELHTKQWPGIARHLRVLFTFRDKEQYNEALKLARAEFEPTILFNFLYIPRVSYSEKYGIVVAPRPNPDIVTAEWQRIGKSPFQLYKP